MAIAAVIETQLRANVEGFTRGFRTAANELKRFEANVKQIERSVGMSMDDLRKKMGTWSLNPTQWKKDMRGMTDTGATLENMGMPDVPVFAKKMSEYEHIINQRMVIPFRRIATTLLPVYTGLELADGITKAWSGSLKDVEDWATRLPFGIGRVISTVGSLVWTISGARKEQEQFEKSVERAAERSKTLVETYQKIQTGINRITTSLGGTESDYKYRTLEGRDKEMADAQRAYDRRVGLVSGGRAEAMASAAGIASEIARIDANARVAMEVAKRQLADDMRLIEMKYDKLDAEKRLQDQEKAAAKARELMLWGLRDKEFNLQNKLTDLRDASRGQQTQTLGSGTTINPMRYAIGVSASSAKKQQVEDPQIRDVVSELRKIRQEIHDASAPRAQ